VRLLIVLILITVTSCIVQQKTNVLTKQDTLPTRSIKYQEEIDTLLALDADNKKWERLYLREIAIAQDNDDNTAYEFFIIEFIKIPRLIIPEWLQDEPGYVPKLTDAEILRRQFMTNTLDR